MFLHDQNSSFFLRVSKQQPVTSNRNNLFFTWLGFIYTAITKMRSHILIKKNDHLTCVSEGGCFHEADQHIYKSRETFMKGRLRPECLKQHFRLSGFDAAERQTGSLSVQELSKWDFKNFLRRFCDGNEFRLLKTSKLLMLPVGGTKVSNSTQLLLKRAIKVARKWRTLITTEINSNNMNRTRLCN